MKSKLITAILLFTLVFSLTACGGNSDDSNKSPDSADAQTEEQKEEKQEEAEEPKTDEQQPSQEQTDTETQTPEQQPVAETASVTVYYSNADATDFESSEVQIESLSPEAVLEALVSKGVLTADIAENSFTMNTVDQKASIELDLNKAFATYLSNMGTTGEYYTVGALVNTFLDAYECEQILITVDGDTLSTGHAEYPGYLTKFE